MLTLSNGTTVTEYEAATALTLAARRQGKSYGQLVSDTDWWTQEQIVLAYLVQNRGAPRRKGRPAGKTCGDCALWMPDPAARAGGCCPIPKKGTDVAKYTNRKNHACIHFTSEAVS